MIASASADEWWDGDLMARRRAEWRDRASLGVVIRERCRKSGRGGLARGLEESV